MNQDFINYVKDHIREYLPPECQDADVSINEVTKSNDRTLTGLTIRQPGEQTAPAIYLEPFAEQMEAGHPLDSLLRQIAEVHTAYRDRLPFDVSVFENYAAVRPMLSIQMCDPETNREYLADKPHSPCGDLAAFYRIQIVVDEDGSAAAAVTDSMIQMWGITKDQLHQDAVQAEKEKNTVCFYDMNDLMAEMFLSEEPNNLFHREESLDSLATPMYVLTNQNKLNGANVLAQEGVLEKVGGLLGSNFFVLPSSVHEVIIVPDNGNIQYTELENMVQEINATQVAPEERLSDKVQYYDREAKTLGRRQEKSVLGQLADKKAQVRQTEAAPKTKQTGRNEPGL